MDHVSGTTDQSHLQSSELEDLEAEAESASAPIEETLRKVLDFASKTYNLELSEQQMSDKLTQMRE